MSAPIHRFALVMGALLLAASAGCADDTEPTLTPDAAQPDAAALIVDATPPDASVADAEPDRAVDAAESPDQAIDAGPIDRDGDGVPDDEDAFPDDPSEWSDRDGDGVGDNTDVFPNNPEESSDLDRDGQGDNEDDDDDGDGIPDLEEAEYGADCARSSPLQRDTDGDGIEDGEDPFPRDPFPEFMVRRNEVGTIDLFLSNRDGTFQPPVPVGQVLEADGRMLGYTGFSIGDFDGDGIMDFLAHTDVLVEGQPERDLYLFIRDDKADEFVQRPLGRTDRVLTGVVGDLDGDFDFDIARIEITRDGNVAGGALRVYLNNGHRVAPCPFGDALEDGCFFTALPPQDLTDTVGGQWIARGAFQAVDLDPENGGFVDLTLTTYPNGGNSPTSVYTLFGRGDGTFGAPVLGFVHNQDRSRAPANTVMFADFDGDGVGDVCLGFDDDGAAGEAWTYFGVGDGSFFPQPVSAVDLNPGDAREAAGGRETLGRTSSGRTFDFDFDGAMDLIVGYDHQNYSGPGQTRLYRGQGNGAFGPEFTVIGPESNARHAFAIPQQRCAEFAARPR